MKTFASQLKIGSLLITSSVLLYTSANAAKATFEVVCGTRTLIAEKLVLKNSNLYAVMGLQSSGPLELPCEVKPSDRLDIGAFCKNGRGGFQFSDKNSDGKRRPVLHNRLSMGTFGGQIARPWMTIESRSSEIVITEGDSYYGADVSLFVPIADASASCEVLPFTWSDSSC